jgi:hypothetical protein
MRRTAVLVAMMLISVLTFGVEQVAVADDGDGGETIHLIEKDTGFTHLDLGEKGDSVGDEDIFTADLFDTSGHKIGHDAGICVAVGTAGQCQATSVINGDQLTLAALIDFSVFESSQPTFTVAITGGTGRFRRARGDEVITESESGSMITIHLK